MSIPKSSQHFDLETVDLHKLRIFVTIARLASFTRAAERLHMTQPTVSQQLSMLEAALGMPLIERDTRHLRLTPAGETLLIYGEKLLALSTEAVEATRAAAGLASRILRIGVGNTLATYLLPHVLSQYRVLYPRYIVRISVGNTAELLSLLASDSIDLAMVGSPAEHTDIMVEPFMRDKLVVIVSPSDIWANRTEVYLEELRSRILLTREPGSALHATIERLLGAEIFNDDNVIVLGETEAIKRSVEAGLGVAMIQGIAIKREIAAGNLISLALQGGDDSRTYLIARRKKRELSLAAQSLMDLLKSSNV